jgi:lipopolysaccharide biosynthesis protein
MKPKVLITRKILPEALDYLKEHTDYEIGATKRNLTKEEIIKKVQGNSRYLWMTSTRKSSTLPPP